MSLESLRIKLEVLQKGLAIRLWMEQLGLIAPSPAGVHTWEFQARLLRWL